MDGEPFDYIHLVDELRCHSTEWLRLSRVEVVREQRRLHVCELAITAVLDERGAFDDTVAAVDGVSLRRARETLETAEPWRACPRSPPPLTKRC